MNAKKKQPNAPACANPADAWERLVARVVEPFDLSDVGQRWAVEKWRKYVAAERDGEPLGKVVHEFASDEVLATAVAFFRVDIEENIAIFRAKVAKNRRYPSGAATGLLQRNRVCSVSRWLVQVPGGIPSASR